MQFYDEVTITVQSGKGGDGAVAGRREKYEAYGGPSGGDGGQGGSVIFVGSKDEYTLLPYRYNKHFKAQNGDPGQAKEKYGQAGEDVRLPVPLGTVVKRTVTGQTIGHITEDGQEFVVAKGGKGGVGNMHFANASNQFPSMALKGEPGEKKEITLELQLLGDVALIGTPSVGKSTLINTLSNQQVKTAAYEFTTLVPHLGVVEHKNHSFILVDVPGLIKDAHKGKGLGNVFLRHILKARLFAIVLDMAKERQGMDEVGLLLDEIVAYVDQACIGQERGGIAIEKIDHTFFYQNDLLRYRATTEHKGETTTLLQKSICIIVNKYDLYDDTELREEYMRGLQPVLQAYFSQHGLDLDKEQINQLCFPVSAMSRAGLDDWLDFVLFSLDKDDYATYTDHASFAVTQPPAPSLKEITDTETDYLLKAGYINKMDAKYVAVWQIYHPDLARLVYMVPWGNDEAEYRFWRTAEREGLLKRLRNAGARKGDILKILSPYAGTDNRYILRD